MRVFTYFLIIAFVLILHVACMMDDFQKSSHDVTWSDFFLFPPLKKIILKNKIKIK